MHSQYVVSYQNTGLETWTVGHEVKQNMKLSPAGGGPQHVWEPKRDEFYSIQMCTGN